MEIRLRPVAESDLPALFEHQNDEEATAMAAFPPRDRDAFFAHWKKILADPELVAHAIETNGVVAGNIVSWVEDGKREVGYWIGKTFWGSGLATAALREFLRLVTERPLYAWVAEHNAGSIRVLEKCGFTRSEAQPEPAHGLRHVVFEFREPPIRAKGPADSAGPP